MRAALRAPARRLLGGFLRRPRVERVVATLLRSSAVRESGRFAFREATGSRAVHRYRLRESGLVAVVRHGTPDVPTLDEVFYQRQYELPEAVLARLEPGARIVDLGANIGLFGLFVEPRVQDVRLTALEPDPANFAVLRACRDANGLGWTLVEAAAATRAGTVPFTAGRFSLSQVGPGDATSEVEAVDAFEHLREADLAKIDIEGSEWELLADERLAPAGPRALVLEYHPRHAPGADATAEVRRLLASAGYETGPPRPTAEGHGVIWAWR